MIARVVPSTILPNEMEVKQTLLDILIVEVAQFLLNGGQIHRMMDDVKVVVELKGDVVYWSFEVLAVFVLEEAVNDGQ